MFSSRVSALLTCFLLLGSGVTSSSVVVDVEVEVGQAIRDLSSSDVRRRYWATVILGRYPEVDSRGLTALLSSVEDSEWTVRLGVARALEATAPFGSAEESSSALTVLLRDPFDQVRAAASFALAEVGLSTTNVLPLLRAGTKSSVECLQLGSWVALRRLYPQSTDDESAFVASQLAGRMLLATLDVESTWVPHDDAWAEAPKVRAIRLAGASAFLNPQYANTLVPELVEHYLAGSSLAVHAGRALAPYLADFVEEWLLASTSDDFRVQQEALLAIGLLGVANEEAVGLLVGLLRHEVVAGTAVQALGLLGSEAQEAVIDLEEMILSSPDAAIRRSAGLALIDIDPSRVALLAPKLRRVDPELALRLQKLALLSQL